MTTYNTGNPIGSTDARDRLDNSENMDILENSTTLNYHADRLGTMRKTRKGMELEHDNQITAHEAEHDAQISAHEAEHDAQMLSFENDFDGRLAGMAFTRVGTFTTGATLTDMRQALLWEVSQGGDGHEYGWAGSFLPAGKVVAAGATPASTGGVGAGAWVDRTDMTLRNELVTGVGELIGIGNDNTLNDVVDFVSPKFQIGESDDTNSIIRALNTGLPVKMTKASYSISGEISLPNASILHGLGKLKTTVTCTTSSARIYSPGSRYNIRLKGFSVNCNGIANDGIILGDGINLNAHHKIDDVAVYGHLQRGIALYKGIYHEITQTVYVHDGAGIGVLLDNVSISKINGVHYNNTLGSCIVRNKSGYNEFSGKLYNDIAYPSDFLMLVDSAFGNKINFTFEPQGANNVRTCLLLNRTYSGTNTNCSDNKIIGKFIGVATSVSEAPIIIGETGAVYKTDVDGVQCIKQNAGNSILLKSQADTRIVDSVDLVTYDTPTTTDITVTNSSGNHYYFTSKKSQTFLPSSGSFTPTLTAGVTNPTVTYSNQYGTYYKIGDMCFFDLYVSISALSSSGSGGVKISGLPFSQKIATQKRASVSIGGYNFTTANNITGYIEEGTNSIAILECGSASLAALTTDKLNASSSLRISGCYQV